MTLAFPQPPAAALEAMARHAEVHPGGPVFAWITPTGRCNLYCTHCPIRVVPKVPEDAPDIGADVVERFVGEVLPGLETIKIGGNNNAEPTLAHTFDAFFERVRRPGLRPWIVTNGTLLTDAQIERLAAAGTVFDFSFDAATPKAYKRIRGRGYEQVMHGIREAVAARDRHPGAGAEVWLSPTVFHDNLAEMPRVVKLALEVGADGVRISNVIPQSEAQRYQSLVYHRAEADRTFAECRRLVAESGRTLALVTPEPFADGPMQTDTKVVREEPARADCVHPWTSTSIDENGLVHPCCVSDQVLGDLKKQTFAEIWNGRRYRRLRRRVNSRSPPFYCRRCVLRAGGNATLSPGAKEEDLLAAIGPARGLDPVQSALFYLLAKAPRSIVAKVALRTLQWKLDAR